MRNILKFEIPVSRATIAAFLLTSNTVTPYQMFVILHVFGKVVTINVNGIVKQKQVVKI